MLPEIMSDDNLVKFLTKSSFLTYPESIETLKERNFPVEKLKWKLSKDSKIVVLQDGVDRYLLKNIKVVPKTRLDILILLDNNI